MGKWIDYTQVSSVADDDTIMINGKNLATKQALLSELNAKITELESNGTGSGSGLSSSFISALQAILQEVSYYNSNVASQITALSSYAGSSSGGSSSGGSTMTETTVTVSQSGTSLDLTLSDTNVTLEVE